MLAIGEAPKSETKTTFSNIPIQAKGMAEHGLLPRGWEIEAEIAALLAPGRWPNEGLVARDGS